jgi:hypothetical protein
MHHHHHQENNIKLRLILRHYYGTLTTLSTQSIRNLLTCLQKFKDVKFNRNKSEVNISRKTGIMSKGTATN